MNYEINPLKQVGSIKFGQNRTKVRNNIKQPYKEFKKSVMSKTTTDDFGQFHVFYNTQNKVEAIEFFNCDAVLKLDGCNLFALPVKDLEAFLRHRDEAIERDVDRLTSHLLGLTVYVPELDVSQNAIIGSITVFQAGYYT